MVRKFDYWRLDGKIYILGDRARRLYHQQRIQLRLITPITLPDMSSKGPPLFPGWIGVEVCRTRVSSLSPAKEVTLPKVKLPLDDSRPDSGKP